MTIVSLQALRGLAALGVVLFHLLPFEAKYLHGLPVIPGGFAAGRAGVDLFFGLSGFLAVWTTRRASGAASARHFLWRRVTRIYPTFWVYCLPLIVVALGPWSDLSNDAQPNLVASLMLLPNSAPPLLLVAWTLEFEIYFYLVFAALIWARLGQRDRILALVAWGSVVALLHITLAPARTQALLDAVLSPLAFEFLAGCTAAYVCTSGIPRAATRLVGLAGCAILATGLACSEAVFALPWLHVGVFGIGTACLLIGCFGDDAAIRRALPGVIIRIGDTSYSLYLSHLFTIGVIGYALRRFATAFDVLATPGGHAAVLAVTVGAALLVAEASYRWIESPLLGVMHHWTRRPGLQTAAAE